ncbi:MAG: hypothetical protein CMJ83_20585 [Planctomycetes bacterium]|nr:hypothetical protein [Planctomycetota bacterium]
MRTSILTSLISVPLIALIWLWAEWLGASAADQARQDWSADSEALVSKAEDPTLASQVTDLVETAAARSLERGFTAVGPIVEPGAAGEDARRFLDDRARALRAELRAKARILGEEFAAERARVRREELALFTDSGEESAANRTHRRVRHTVRIYSWFVIPAVWLLVLFFRRRVLRPLATATAAMDEVAGGGDRRLDPGVARPLGDLHGGFNRMVDMLTATRRELEERVDEKTAALGTALSESRELNGQLKAVLAELEEAQEKLVSQEKMAALGTLAGGIAHEFNNLLGGIRGCADDLLSEAEDDDVRETLAVIVRAARRGRTIVEGLQHFSQSGSRAPRPVDVEGVVNDVVKLLTPMAAERDVALRIAGAHGLGVVIADKGELHQVLLNLVLNAVQAAPAGSTVDVTLAATDVGVAVEVLDRGPGIPDAIRERVFEPFYTTREREGGTGLGLAISHGIVAGLGGTLGLSARDGGGTTFRLELRAGSLPEEPRS